MAATPRAPLMTLADALNNLLSHIEPLPGSESVATFDADGRVLAENLVSALQVPAFDNSSMDGYAVRCADLREPGVVLAVTQRIAAGQTGQPLQAGQAARIFTGAPVPPGADAIVMQEQTEALAEANAAADGAAVSQTPRVRFLSAPEPGQWIRRSGEDIRQGDTALHRGKSWVRPSWAWPPAWAWPMCR